VARMPGAAEAALRPAAGADQVARPKRARGPPRRLGLALAEMRQLHDHYGASPEQRSNRCSTRRGTPAADHRGPRADGHSCPDRHVPQPDPGLRRRRRRLGR
jgi:hypothetical protein